MGILLTIENTVLRAQQKKRQKIPFFDQTKHKNKQKKSISGWLFCMMNWACHHSQRSKKIEGFSPFTYKEICIRLS